MSEINKKYSRITDVPKDAFANQRINNNYLLINEIGRGTFGLVYKAKDLSNPLSAKENFFAIKMMIVPNVKSENDKLREQEMRDEIKKYSTQIFNPRVVKIQDYLQWENYLLIVMEYVDGQSLQKMLWEKDGMLTFEEIIYYFSEIAYGLQGVHDMNMVHRDIKPGNILLTKERQIKITDFGISHVKGLVYDGGNIQKTKKPSSPGTPRYASPEEYIKSGSASDDKNSFQSDIYSLGVMLYEATTGSEIIKINNPKLFRPTEDADRKKREAFLLDQTLVAEFLAPSLLNPTINKDLELIIMKCLERNLANRYRTANEVAEDLKKVGRGEKVNIKKTKNEPYKTESIKKLENDNKKFEKFNKKFINKIVVPVIIGIFVIAILLLFVLLW
ncbi:serine/threonine protein kinase [Mesoplasma chauliocola]|uniref:Serine/threonine protein kinase n=1 Tax=Mesoplasma chauliocola TaxID=216427 RepID=A0A249SMZ9_9MOLU|nr:serine/threonine-protein kinase [Mesoplasma chauliocola]ASZ08977.1 serine/threonine protein kinase [Mesoplasma chauliocola]